MNNELPTQRPSAAIIAFPGPKALPAPADQDPAARLRAALTALDNAVRSQRSAVADWQAAIGDLRATMGTLGQSMHSYRENLAVLDGRVTSLADTARRLQSGAAAVEDGQTR